MRTKEVLAELEHLGRYWGPKGAVAVATDAESKIAIVDWVSLWSHASTNAYEHWRGMRTSSVWLEEQPWLQHYVTFGLKAWCTAVLVSVLLIKYLRPKEVLVVGDVLSRGFFSTRWYGVGILEELTHRRNVSYETKVLTLIRLYELGKRSEVDLSVFVWGSVTKPCTEEDALITRCELSVWVTCRVLTALNNAELADTIARKHAQAETVRAIATAFTR